MEVTVERIMGTSYRDKSTPVPTKVMRIRIDGVQAGTICVNPGSKVNLHQWGWTPEELKEIEKQISAALEREVGEVQQPIEPPIVDSPVVEELIDDFDDEPLEG